MTLLSLAASALADDRAHRTPGKHYRYRTNALDATRVEREPILAAAIAELGPLLDEYARACVEASLPQIADAANRLLATWRRLTATKETP